MSDKLDALVERLNLWSNRNGKPINVGELNVMCREAADAITALRAQLAAQAGQIAGVRLIADGDYDRPVSRVWRDDGVSSKHDKCAHDLSMYEECADCMADAIRAALDLAPAATGLTGEERP